MPGAQCMELHAVRPSLEETLSRHMLRSRGGYQHLHCTGNLARNVATIGALAESTAVDRLLAGAAEAAATNAWTVQLYC